MKITTRNRDQNLSNKRRITNMTTPVITKMEVYPVAGKDCMELNLSGAHAPYFTRNVVVLYADNGEMGVGEVPGGKKITNALEECIPLVEGTKVAEYKSTLLKVKKHLDSKGEEDVRGNQTFDLRTGVHVDHCHRSALPGSVRKAPGCSRM